MKLKGTTIKVLKAIPLGFGVGFIIYGLPTKQYTFCFLGIFALISFLLVFLLTPRIKDVYRLKIQTILIVSIISGGIIFGFLARGTLPTRKESEVWTMHQIDNPGYMLPNGLGAADINKDGFLDYVTNYEWDGKIRIAFHPGVDSLSNPWPAITVGNVPNAENAEVGDFDRDGNIDIVVAHGMEFSTHSGVFFIWGPESNKTMSAEEWVQSEDIDATIGTYQFHYVRSHDINGDGIDDVVVGGRGTNPRAGLKWIEAPTVPSERRDLSKWALHEIDLDLESGYGFEFGDIDNDGDEDIVLCNSDWDTLDSEEMVLYYENPSVGTAAQKQEWTKHVIYQGPEFYTKEQVELYDFSGDGFPEVIMQLENYVYYFKNPGNTADPWTLLKIEKPPFTQSRARPIKIGDINNDGKPDIFGMLIHTDGYLSTEKAAVFWMDYTGSDIETAEWTTHPIKWGDGFYGIGTFNGEKWDQGLFVDVDLDGDLDIVANCEEFSSLGFLYLAVVWFENPTITS